MARMINFMRNLTLFCDTQITGKCVQKYCHSYIRPQERALRRA